MFERGVQTWMLQGMDEIIKLILEFNRISKVKIRKFSQNTSLIQYYIENNYYSLIFNQSFKIKYKHKHVCI